MSSLLSSSSTPERLLARLAAVGGSARELALRTRRVPAPAAAFAGGVLVQLASGWLARRRATSERSTVLATLASASGAIAVGALAVGAVSVGALAIGRLAVRSAHIKRLRIDVLDVRQTVSNPVQPGAPSPS